MIEYAHRPPYSFPPVNNAVEPQRPGWCVFDRINDRWPTALPTFCVGLKWGRARDAHVYLSLEVAQHQACVLFGCVATTAPRFNGHVVEWTEL